MAQKVGCICTLYKVRALPSTQSSESGVSKSFWVVLCSPQNVRLSMVMVSRTLEFTHAVMRTWLLEHNLQTFLIGRPSFPTIPQAQPNTKVLPCSFCLRKDFVLAQPQ